MHIFPKNLKLGMIMLLYEEKCHHVQASEKPLGPDEVKKLLYEVPDWNLKGDTIERIFQFHGFMEAIDFVNRVAEIADTEDHHPDIYISYNKVRLDFSTHKIKGLSRNDFIMASKCSMLDLDTIV